MNSTGCKIFIFIILLNLSVEKVISQNFDAEVIKYTTFCEFERNNLAQTDSVIFQINNRAGDLYTDISIPFSEYDKVSEIDGWIENMNGTKVRNLKNNEINERSAISDISLYEDNYVKYFQLKHNIYPYKIIYTYKTTYRNYITLAWWNPIIHKDIPTRNARLKIKIPVSMQYFTYTNKISDSIKYRVGNDLILEWKSSYNEPLTKETFSQPENNYPKVIVAPLNFYYEISGSLKDWKSFGNWQCKLLQDLDVLPDDEKKTISSLIAGVTNKREITKILYHYMQDHTRYVNVMIGTGGLKPYPASYVATNKYGDCKALTNYMKSILSFVGIESYYTNIESGLHPSNVKLNFAAPLFNHVILAVPLGDDTIWLENTSNTNPFGYLGTFTQNRNALWVSKDNSHLVRTPALTVEDNHVSNTFTFDLQLDGNALLNLQSSYKGYDFEWFDYIQSELNDNDRDKIIRKYMPFTNYEITNWDLKKLHRDTAHIELNATLILFKFINSLGDEFYFSLYPCQIPQFTIPANRKLTVELPFPIYNSYTLIYNLPTGYEMKNKPDTISIKTIYGNYEMTTRNEKNKIIVNKKFELFSGIYSLEQYPEFYQFIKNVKDVDRNKIIIKPLK